MSKILFIGDVVGKSGRKILRAVLPEWKEKYKPDVVIVNVENLAHGKGVTQKTLAELDELDIDCYTSGNHIFSKSDFSKECFEKYDKLIRPANYESLLDKAKQKQAVPGHGYYRFSKPVVAPFMEPQKPDESGNYNADKQSGVIHNNQQFLVINLNGQVFMEKQFDGEIGNPFLTIDSLLTSESQKGDIIIVDFHAEATSEKIAMGYYLDGRVSALVGTHTHVPTADARILPQGTAYITDAGMTGSLNSVIGVKKENVLEKFLNPESKFKNEPEEEGAAQINGVTIEIGGNQKVVKIERVYQELF